MMDVTAAMALKVTVVLKVADSWCRIDQVLMQRAVIGCFALLLRFAEDLLVFTATVSKLINFTVVACKARAWPT